MHSIMPIFGTRPEAIKMAPIVSALQESAHFRCIVTVTGQHREMLDQVNELFGIVPDHDLNILQQGQSLSAIMTRTIDGLETLFAGSRPDAVVVQGDTTTSTAAAIAAFYHGIPVVHVEAGLRSGDLLSPFPGGSQPQDHQPDRPPASGPHLHQPGKPAEGRRQPGGHRRDRQHGD